MLPLFEVRQYTAEIVAIIEELNSYGIAHRGIKLQNLVFDEDGHLKLVDFAGAKLYVKTPLNETKFDTVRKKLIEIEKQFKVSESFEDDGMLDEPLNEEAEWVSSEIYKAPETMVNGYSDFETDYWALGRPRVKQV